MKLVVSLEQRFDILPDGSVWANSIFSNAFFDRYRDVFEEIRVIARIRHVDKVPEDSIRADGDNVTFWPVPYYVGPWQYLRKAAQIRHSIKDAVESKDAIIMRVGSQIATLLVPTLRKMSHPYGLEVVGDPYDVFGPGVIRHPLRPAFRQWFSYKLRSQCAHACAIAYVNRSKLQLRYPPQSKALSISYSSIELTDKAFIENPKKPRLHYPIFNLVFVGSLSQLYKGPDILLLALARVVECGFDVRASIIGDGRFRSVLERQKSELGLDGRIKFLGQLSPGDPVREQLDQADLFVLPSKTEGLPQALIEAMARGLPCISTNVGGIPDLLPPTELVPSGDSELLARKICEVLRDPDRRQSMALRNLEKAREYHHDILRKRRISFYKYVKEYTEKWIQART